LVVKNESHNNTLRTVKKSFTVEDHVTRVYGRHMEKGNEDGTKGIGGETSECDEGETKRKDTDTLRQVGFGQKESNQRGIAVGGGSGAKWGETGREEKAETVSRAALTGMIVGEWGVTGAVFAVSYKKNGRKGKKKKSKGRGDSNEL